MCAIQLHDIGDELTTVYTSASVNFTTIDPYIDNTIFLSDNDSIGWTVGDHPSGMTEMRRQLLYYKSPTGANCVLNTKWTPLFNYEEILCG